ncbi:MAG TPA: Zn-ribbon domain-containing OB-fold protein [Thermomicrobiaceae bacterium]|nr:Zn-ribbon domain-containing OB-fold protein [Thermomicrobiaceae bacterium]
MSTPRKPLPTPDGVTAPYWESVKAHAMQVQHCNACGQTIFYPRGLCPNCFSSDLAWQPVSGKGKLHAFTIVHRHPNPAFAADAPYVVALVELDEGVRLMSNLIGVEADPEHVKVGMPVEVVYEDVTEAVTLPKFRPA